MTARALHTTRRRIDLGRQFGDSSRSEDIGMFGFSRSFSRAHSRRSMSKKESNNALAVDGGIRRPFHIGRSCPAPLKQGGWSFATWRLCAFAFNMTSVLTQRRRGAKKSEFPPYILK